MHRQQPSVTGPHVPPLAREVTVGLTVLLLRYFNRQQCKAGDSADAVAALLFHRAEFPGGHAAPADQPLRLPSRPPAAVPRHLLPAHHSGTGGQLALPPRHRHRLHAAANQHVGCCSGRCGRLRAYRAWGYVAKLHREPQERLA